MLRRPKLSKNKDVAHKEEEGKCSLPFSQNQATGLYPGPANPINITLHVLSF
jgi:hypothetical protein